MGRGPRLVAIAGAIPSMLLLLAQGCASSRPSGPSPIPAPPVASRAAGPASAPGPLAEAKPEGDWVAGAHADLRRLTVLVRVKPPDEIVAKFTELANHVKRLKPWSVAAASGGFGSGFVLVRRGRDEAGHASTVDKFVVTNLHVMGLATHAAISFEGSKGAIDAPVVYVDPAYDLAVLSLDRAAGDAATLALVPAEGFDLQARPAKDQDPVVASGYPAVGDDPSYQVTRGYVSNERFEVTEGGRSQAYVQHTAPIDPGSSGGPLTTPEGKLLGVNTLKVRRRENVGLAIPAAAVAQAVGLAATVRGGEGAPSHGSAREACDALLAALARGQDDLGEVERAITAAMVAREGLSSLDDLPRGDADWAQAFLEAPTEVFLHAIALRILSEVAAAKGATPEGCVPTASGDSTLAPSFQVRTRAGKRTWTFCWEQERWKLTDGALSSAGERPSLFQENTGSNGARKKWTPSLK